MRTTYDFRERYRLTGLRQAYERVVPVERMYDLTAPKVARDIVEQLRRYSVVTDQSPSATPYTYTPYGNVGNPTTTPSDMWARHIYSATGRQMGRTTRLKEVRKDDRDKIRKEMLGL